MQRDAYGIFLVHYAFALWIQYWLSTSTCRDHQDADRFRLRWQRAGLDAVLRRIPGSQRVL